MCWISLLWGKKTTPRVLTESCNDKGGQGQGDRKGSRKRKETIKTICYFETKSETYFFSEMMPRLKKIDSPCNKATLF